jgi:WD40 repeat protein
MAAKQDRFVSDGQAHLALTPDGTRLVTGARDGTVRVWDVASGNELRKLAEPRKGPVTALAVMKEDNTVLCAAGFGQEVRVWDLNTGRVIGVLAGPAGATARCVGFSRGGGLLAAGFGPTVRLWRPRSGEVVGDIAAGCRVHAAAFNPDGTSLALAGADKAVQVWDVAARQQRAALKGHSREVTAVAFSPDGKTLISGSGPLLSSARQRPGEALVWDGGSGPEADDPDDEAG